MIEVVYKGEAQGEQDGIALPKNVRQVGEIQRNRRIYIEDYVVTYMRQKIEENKNLGCVLILTGRKEYVQDTLYLFADGAFLVEYEQVGKDYVFSDRVWESVYEQVKEYFSGGEIVGWLLYDDDLTKERLLKAQRKNFPAEDMLLIKREAYEEDCTCYLYRNGSLDELPGYFVYYEKNETMQEFLVKNYQNAARAAEEEQAIRKKEEPVVNFRKRMQKNREPRKRAGTGTHGILYAAGSFLLLLVIITGITMVNNYDKMQQFETAADLAGTLQGGSGTQQTSAAADTSPADQARVEEAPSGVTPLPSAQESDSAEEQKQGDQTRQERVQPEELQAEDAQPEEARPEASQPEATAQAEDEQTEEAQAENEQPEEAPAEEQRQEESSRQQADTPASANIPVQYTVQPGDTLLAISKRVYGTDQMVGKICAANGINDGDKILAGQKILLP